MASILTKAKSIRSESNWFQLIRIAGFLNATLAAGFILMFIVLAIIRMQYPYELEWIEGSHLDEVRWILAGHFPYIPPSISFLPSVKNPLYFYLAAGLLKIIGGGFLGPRLISTLSTIGCLLFIYVIVVQETERPLFGLLAAGIYAATFRFTGAWMDLAKTDSLFLVLVLAAFYIGTRVPNKKGMVFSGLLFVAAYYTKQIALPIVLVLAPIFLVVTRGRSWLQWLTTGAVGLFLFWALDKISAGWYSFYTFDILTTHPRVPSWFSFWESLLRVMWPAAILAVVYLILTLRETDLRSWKWDERPWQNLGFGLALLLASWSVFFKVWTYDNGYMPAALGLALLSGLGMGKLYNAALPLLKTESLITLAKTAAAVLLIIQFAILYYNPLAQLPTRQDRQAGEELVNFIRALPGKVWLFSHGNYNELAGKETFLHSAPYGDIVRGDLPPKKSDTYERRKYAEQVLNQAVQTQIFNWIIVDQPDTSWFPYYLDSGPIFKRPNVLYPVTGAPSRPESLMIKNPAARGGNMPLSDPDLNFLFINGWSAPQEWGRWILKTTAISQIALEKRHDYQIQVELTPTCTGDEPIVSSIAVSWNGKNIARQSIDSCDPQSLMINLSKDLISKEMNQLKFEFGDTAPVEAKSNNSTNHRLAKITRLKFTQQ
jgi:hypothetical protein